MTHTHTAIDGSKRYVKIVAYGPKVNHRIVETQYGIRFTTHFAFLDKMTYVQQILLDSVLSFNLESIP